MSARTLVDKREPQVPMNGEPEKIRLQQKGLNNPSNDLPNRETRKAGLDTSQGKQKEKNKQ